MNLRVVGLLSRADRHLVKINVSHCQSEQLTGAKPCKASRLKIVLYGSRAIWMIRCVRGTQFEIDRFGSVAVSCNHQSACRNVGHADVALLGVGEQAPSGD